MNKDALLATVIGFGIGLLITGVLLFAPNISKKFPKITLPNVNLSFLQPTQKKSVKPTPTPKPFGVTIDSPLAEAIENKSTLLVSGTSQLGSLIVIQGVADEDVVRIKEDSKYAGTIALVEGKNDITVTSYLKDKQETATVTVYYTPDTF